MLFLETADRERGQSSLAVHTIKSLYVQHTRKVKMKPNKSNMLGYMFLTCNPRRPKCDPRRATCDPRRATCYPRRATCYVFDVSDPRRATYYPRKRQKHNMLHVLGTQENVTEQTASSTHTCARIHAYRLEGTSMHTYREDKVSMHKQRGEINPARGEKNPGNLYSVF